MSVLDTILAAERAATDLTTQARDSAGVGQTAKAMELVERSKGITAATSQLRAALGTGSPAAVAMAEGQLKTMVSKYAKTATIAVAGVFGVSVLAYVAYKIATRNTRKKGGRR